MVHIEQLNGDWISKDCYPMQLGKEGYRIKFRFNHASGTASLSTIDKDGESILYAGDAQVKPYLDNEFLALIDQECIPIRNFANDRFIAEVPDYGKVTVYKTKVLGMRMSF